MSAWVYSVRVELTAHEARALVAMVNVLAPTLAALSGAGGIGGDEDRASLVDPTFRSPRDRAMKPDQSDSGGTFADATRGSGRLNMCPRCGEREVAGVVAVKISEKTMLNTSVRQVGSRQLSACEPCCVAIWTSLSNMLADAVGREESR